MNFELLHTIIDQFEIFEKDTTKSKTASIEDFAAFILAQSEVKKPKESSKQNKITQDEIEVGISRLLVYMYRYARIHLKNAMVDFPELINEDFTYLYTLVRYGNMTKIQLIERNIHEKSSGLEIIKRLLKHELVSESEDQNDKRSKQIMLTEKGKTAFHDSVETTTNVAKLISGNLNYEEKNTFFYLLKKLDSFHNPIYLSK